jgi:bifunctional DNA-binding transcriptional regulator/antitoxin component of YhaV-PrlF toxin-antitoxin module
MSTRFKPKFNIKKGDTVVVIAGDDKDLKKPRKVLEVIVDKGRVVVEGVNLLHKIQKVVSLKLKPLLTLVTLCYGTLKRVNLPKLRVHARMVN